MAEKKNLQSEMQEELNLTSDTSTENKIGDDALEPTIEPTSNGKLYGVLVMGALLVKRGCRFVQVTCPKQISDSAPVQQGMWSVSNPKICSDSCVMFSEPRYNNDGTAEIDICDKTLVFNKLIDLRGNLNDINIATATHEEIIQWLIDNNIVSG